MSNVDNVIDMPAEDVNDNLKRADTISNGIRIERMQMHNDNSNDVVANWTLTFINEYVDVLQIRLFRLDVVVVCGVDKWTTLKLLKADGVIVLVAFEINPMITYVITTNE